MNCHSVQMNMASYIARSLHPIRMKEIDNHLEECGACSAWHRTVLEMERTWNDPSLPALDEDLTPAVMTIIANRPNPYRRRKPFNPLLKMALASSCALVLFMCTGAAFFDTAVSNIGAYNEHFAHSIANLYHNLSGNS